MPETCGHPTSTGDPCQLPAGPDGTCHLDTHQPEQDTCGHPTSDGSPCKLPAGPDGSCHIPAHGGHADTHGRPTDLTQDLIDEATDLVENGTLIRDVWAVLDIHRNTWYRWKDKGREDVEENEEPTTIYGRFWCSLMRAERIAHEHYHNLLRDALISRSDVVRGPEGGVTIIPVRLDPDTGEEKRGEKVQTRNTLKYLKTRWPELWAEKKINEHTGKDGAPLEITFSETLQATGDDQDG